MSSGIVTLPETCFQGEFKNRWGQIRCFYSTKALMYYSEDSWTIVEIKFEWKNKIEPAFKAWSSQTKLTSVKLTDQAQTLRRYKNTQSARAPLVCPRPWVLPREPRQSFHIDCHNNPLMTLRMILSAHQQLSPSLRAQVAIFLLIISISDLSILCKICQHKSIKAGARNPNFLFIWIRSDN